MSNTYTPARGIEHTGNAYKVQLMVKGERIELGCYPTLKLARLAQYNAAHYYFGKMNER